MQFQKTTIPNTVCSFFRNIFQNIFYRTIYFIYTVAFDGQQLRDLDDEGVDQIVGGTPAAAGEIPFQVIILIYLLLNNYFLSAKYGFYA